MIARKMAPVALIINPVAGDDSAESLSTQLQQRLTVGGVAPRVWSTRHEGDGALAAREALAAGCSSIYVGGGDGTLNEVLNGVVDTPGALSRVTIGVIPLGTGNDFATALGFSSDLDTALDQLAAAPALAIDVGLVNGRAFVNVSGGGFLAEVSDAVNPRLKTIAGKLAYLIGGAQVLLQYEPLHATIALPADDGLPDVRGRTLALHAFAVCNSRLVGGGRLIAPDARIDDGLLDVCLIAAMPTLDFVALLSKVSNGEHVADERVHYFRTSAIDLTFDREIKVNADGQVLTARSCEYRVMAGAARFLVPPVTDDV